MHYILYVMGVDALSPLIGEFPLSLISSCMTAGEIDQIPWLPAENVPAPSVPKYPKMVCR